MKMTARQQTRNIAKIELNKFLMAWEDKHDLSLEDQAFLLTQEVQVYLKYLVKE